MKVKPPMEKLLKEERERLERLGDEYLQQYGTYRIGLTAEEIKTYLKLRAGTTRLGDLYKRFCKIAGVNTVGVEWTRDRKGELHSISLMYRWDVNKFADNLFLGVPFIWD